MAHHYSNSLYDRLADWLNQFPQGAPLSDSLFAILKILFSEKEAGLVAQLPIKPFTVDRAAAIWKLDKATAQNMLEDLAGRAMLLDMEQNGQQMFCLPPPMAGFFEFSMMRVRGDVNQKALAELYYQYLNVEEDFVKALFVENGTPLGRIFVQEAALPQDGKLEVLDYERASHIIKTASHIGVSMCYCRHKMQHLGRACDAPMDICMTFNTSARSLIKYGHARQVDAAECLDLLAVAQGHNLVQFGENAREGVNFICNCCGCCCEALLAIKRFAIARTIHSNFIARAGNDCRGCGKCEKVCPVNAIHMEDGPAGKRFAFVDPERCIGCGVCVRSCAFGQLTLEARPERAITPLNTVNRVVAMAAERGMIKELLEDNDAMGNHRIMAAVIGDHEASRRAEGARRGAAQIPLSGKPHRQNGMTEAKAPKGQLAMVRKASPAGLFFFLVARGIGIPRKPWTRDGPRSPARRGFSGNPDTLCYIPLHSAHPHETFHG